MSQEQKDRLWDHLVWLVANETGNEANDENTLWFVAAYRYEGMRACYDQKDWYEEMLRGIPAVGNREQGTQWLWEERECWEDGAEGESAMWAAFRGWCEEHGW